MLLIWNPAVFGPFLLSMVVIQCTTVKKLFVSFCWRWLCLRIWRQWGLIHLGVVNDCGGGQLTIGVGVTSLICSCSYIHRISGQWKQSIVKSRQESVFHLSCKICKFWKEFTLEKPTHLPPLATASNPTKLRGQKVGAGAEKVGGRLLRVGLRALRGEVISSVALYKPHQMQPSPLYTLLTTDMDRLTRKTQASAWFSNAQTSNF